MRPILLILLSLLLTIPAFHHTHAQLKNPDNIQHDWSTDTSNHIIDLSEIQVVLPRNSFPLIDYPEFTGKEQGLKQFFRHEPVIAVSLNGRAKAYPLNMLAMHEISNDTLGGIPILPSYCPLCNSALVFDRRLKHQEEEHLLEFEVSGMLRYSNLILADKQTETWWQQLSAKGLAGKLAGAELKIIPSMIITVKEFFESYPKGKILSPETGTKAENRYGTNPYVNYDEEDGKPMEKYFPHEKISGRLPAMERVLEIKSENRGYRIYPFSEIRNKEVINDEFGSKKIVVFYRDEKVSILDESNIRKSKTIGSATAFSRRFKGQTLTFSKKNGYFTDHQTQSKWTITGHCIKGKLKGSKLKLLPHGNHFAFAWLHFYPESEIYRSQE
ncbi:MAG: DUF3179 domain-containing protein [Bacteroidales bacterium]|nr:DUF3179 domain-containing protein [Bacteroidales bacterium]